MTRTPKLMKKTAVALLATSMLAGSAVGIAAASPNKDKHGDNGKNNNKPSSHTNVRINLDFKDLSQKDWAWAYEHIIRLASQGVFKGYDDGSFKPQSKITRIEAIVAAVRLLGLQAEAEKPENMNAKLNFNDFDKLKKKYGSAVGYVAVALENDLFNENDTSINPEQPATRLWASVLLVKAMKLEDEAKTKMDAELPFKDARNIPAGSVGYIKTALDHKLIAGYNDNTFQPNRPVTRAELAVLLDRVGGQLPEDQTAQAITGVVQSNANGAITVKKADGTSVAVPLDANVFVFRNDVKAAASTIAAGDQVLIRTFEGKAVFIEVTKAVEATAPVAISDVSIWSSNANRSIAYVGDTVTLTFKTKEQVTKLGNFKINGSNPTSFTSVGAGDNWTNVATYKIEASDPVGVVKFQINVQNAKGIYSVTTEATSDNSFVSVVKTAPVISGVSLTSSNADPRKATAGDIVTLTFTTNEEVSKLGNFKINGSNPAVFTSVKQADNNWKNIATYVVDSSDPLGVMTFQINVKNAAGLYSITTEATNDGSFVTVY